jgi:hypothetical protein
MNKIATLLTGVLVAGFVSLKMTDTQTEVTGQEELWRVQERLERYYQFKTAFEANLHALEFGTISLKEAQKRAEAAARENNPEYLCHLIHEERGKTDSERVAQNLVGHLRVDQDLKPERAGRLRALQVELAEFLRAAPR